MNLPETPQYNRFRSMTPEQRARYAAMTEGMRAARRRERVDDQALFSRIETYWRRRFGWKPWTGEADADLWEGIEEWFNEMGETRIYDVGVKRKSWLQSLGIVA